MQYSLTYYTHPYTSYLMHIGVYIDRLRGILYLLDGLRVQTECGAPPVLPRYRRWLVHNKDVPETAPHGVENLTIVMCTKAVTVVLALIESYVLYVPSMFSHPPVHTHTRCPIVLSLSCSRCVYAYAAVRARAGTWKTNPSLLGATGQPSKG